MAISRINKNVNAVQDYEDVIAVVDGYIQGLKHGSVDQLRESFHADGIMYGHGPYGLLGGSIDNLYTFVEHYGKDGLRAADVPDPKVGTNDVLVKVSAASINPLDKMVRNGEFKRLLKYRTPFVLGHDVAGVVTRVGSAVGDFQVGDEVYARPRDLRIGTFAEYIAIDQDDVAPKPASLTLHEAAAVPLVSLAAWQALVDRAHVQPGQKVLVHAGSGGLGSTVIQLAKHLGATVATTARGENAELARGLGADVVVDYIKEDFAEVLSGYDVVLDSRGGENLERSLTVLKRGGQAIGVAGPPDPGFAKQLGAPKFIGVVMGLLSRKVQRNGVNKFNFLAQEARKARRRIRLSETNSSDCGWKQNGISDRMASARMSVWSAVSSPCCSISVPATSAISSGVPLCSTVVSGCAAAFAAGGRRQSS